jgi:hypothetical protein
MQALGREEQKVSDRDRDQNHSCPNCATWLRLLRGKTYLNRSKHQCYSKERHKTEKNVEMNPQPTINAIVHLDTKVVSKRSI